MKEAEDLEKINAIMHSDDPAQVISALDKANEFLDLIDAFDSSEEVRGGFNARGERRVQRAGVGKATLSNGTQGGFALSTPPHPTPPHPTALYPPTSASQVVRSDGQLCRGL